MASKREMSEIKELETQIVHSDEAGSQRWNPQTHEQWIVELSDGNKMSHVRPIGEGLNPNTEEHKEKLRRTAIDQ